MTWTHPRILNQLTSAGFIALIYQICWEHNEGFFNLGSIKDIVHMIQDIGKHRLLMLATGLHRYSMQYSAPKREPQITRFCKSDHDTQLGIRGANFILL